MRKCCYQLKMEKLLTTTLLILCWQYGSAITKGNLRTTQGNTGTPPKVKSILITPSRGDVKFLNYKRTRGNVWEWIPLNVDNLQKSGLDSTLPYKIAIHGFLSNCSYAPLTVLKAYAIQKSKANLVCVDWSVLANPDVGLSEAVVLRYPKAVENTRFVGESVSELIVKLLKTGFLNDTNDVHLIGHSLGGHVAGVAGHFVYENQKKKIGRISGLDPAVPIFFPMNFAAKLSKNDASFVDVMYTNMARFGVNLNVAHASFLPNGGAIQPFCKTGEIAQDISETIIGECSHCAAPDIFAKSILESITACKCKSWFHFMFKSSKSGCSLKKSVLFGDKTSRKSTGKFCLHLKSLQ